MRIGVFLGYGPQTSLGKEGLGRYLAGLLKGFQNRGDEVTIACPQWLLKTLDALFKDFEIDKDRIKMMETGKTPVSVWVYKWLKREKKKKKKQYLKRLGQYLADLEKKFIQKVAKTNSLIYFGLLTLLGLLIGAAAAVPCIAASIVFLLFKIALKYGRPLVRIVKAPLVRIKRAVFDMDFLNMVCLMVEGASNDQIQMLVNRINREQPMDVWFVPAIFWPQVNSIHNSTVVINAPDLVSEKFPQGFAETLNASNAIIACRKTLQEGKYFITYCDYLRRTLLEDEYGKATDHTVAISHVNNAMDSYLYIDPALKKRMGVEKNLPLAYAKTLLPLALQKASCCAGYASGYCMEDTLYIFYASQSRPSKNILNLVKAYEYLLRHRFIHQKLVVTCNLRSAKELREYIANHELDNEVIGMYDLSANVLAALYCCADLVVNPTLYEGGFPFTFGEGMSVGTPSVMSDIPQVREVLEPEGLEDIMFDPYDWKAMADKIEWALQNKEALYRRELPLYEKLARRTPEAVVEDYVHAFERFIELDGGKNGGNP